MEKIKKFLKQAGRPVLYVMIGFVLGATVYTAYAAWSDTVVTGEVLSTNLWNNMVAKLVDLEAEDVALNTALNTAVSDINNEINIIYGLISCPCGTCWTTGSDFCFEDFSRDRLCTPGGWLSIGGCHN